MWNCLYRSSIGHKMDRIGSRPLCVDRQMVKNIAKRIFETYDKDRSGTIEEYEMRILSSHKNT